MHILSVGSSVIDLFLTTDKNFSKIENGEVKFRLGDKIPSEIKNLALGGNGANVAVGLTRLEIPTSFYTYLGNDALSREIEEGLAKEGVELAAKRGLIKNAPLHIIFDFDTDRIIFSHYEEADHDFVYEKDQAFDFIFLNSIADVWENAYKNVFEFAKSKNIPLAFSPGSRQLEKLNDTVKNIIGNTKIFFSNRQEAEIVTGKPKGTEIKELLKDMQALGPEIVSITDGAKGAYAADLSGCYFIEPAPSESKEKTGAGDAYATAFFASILHGNNVQTAMSWGTLNAKGVMEKIGAQAGLLKKTELDRLLPDTHNLVAKTI